jgi:adenosylcobinamide-GDP ribazoletransferase
LNAIDGLAAAFVLLTRLPMGRLARRPAPPAPWAFPLVGAVVGLAAGLLLRLAEFEKLPPLVAAGWAVVAVLLLTGALHEDGLADTADGFGGGRTAARKLEIMRDSRIGSFGTLALGGSLLLRVAAMAALPAGLAIPALVVTAAAARAAMLIPLLLLPPARPDGLGAGMAAAPRRASILGLLLAVAAGLTLLPVRSALLLLLAVGVGALLMSALARRQIGGHTGDVLGAVEQIGECLGLTILAGA